MTRAFFSVAIDLPSMLSCVVVASETSFNSTSVRRISNRPRLSCSSTTWLNSALRLAWFSEADIIGPVLLMQFVKCERTASKMFCGLALKSWCSSSRWALSVGI